MINHERCFLEDPRWEHTILGTVLPGSPFSPRSHLNLYLGSRMARMPGLFFDVTHAVCQRDTVSPATLNSLISRGLELRKDLKDCRDIIDKLTASCTFSEADPSYRFEMLGLDLTVSVIVCRLLGAIWPSARDELEDQAIDLAMELQALDDDFGPGNPRVSLYLAQKNAVMSSTVTTTGVWRDKDEHRGHIIPKWKFDAWCAAIPKKTCDGKQCLPLERPMSSGVSETGVGSESSGLESPGMSASPSSSISVSDVSSNDV